MAAGSYLVGLGQLRVEGGRPEANLARAEAMIGDAAAAGCRLVVLPECLDLGWTDPSAREAAEPVPGRFSDRLAAAAREHALLVAAGLVERDGDRRYNTAVLFGADGSILGRHRKVNELPVARELYGVGSSPTVAATGLGTIGLTVCADNLWESRGLGHELCRRGARLIVSPSAWAVDADHDEERDPYGEAWLPTYCELARDHGATVVGVSCVGPIAAGPWVGRVCIGRSLAVGPGGILARGPYGADAEALVLAHVDPA